MQLTNTDYGTETSEVVKGDQTTNIMSKIEIETCEDRKEHNNCRNEDKKERLKIKWVHLRQIEICQKIMNIIYDAETKTIDKIMYQQYKNQITSNYFDAIVGCTTLLKKNYAGNAELCLWMCCRRLPCKRKFKATCSLNDASRGIFQLYRSDHEQTHKNYITRQVRQVDSDYLKECLKNN